MWTAFKTCSQTVCMRLLQLYGDNAEELPEEFFQDSYALKVFSEIWGWGGGMAQICILNSTLHMNFT